MTTKQTPAERLARALLKRARDIEQRTTTPPTIHTVTTHHTATDTGDLIASAQDAYLAIAAATSAKQITRRYIGLTTRGWAAPVNPDQTPPSLHPKRQRVTLIIVHDTTTNKQTSALHIAGKRGALIDHGDAQGELADALAQLAADLTTPPAA